ncbi:dynamin, putative [Bodo saltans]|uniref:Dynamin, putative n=1 Tax=Bodo saltans TaxID=75058 RepID=A0A0S4IST4_BODSA|nr:dynamin, putative [Bodo saltans]|eukprot:CUF06659.1 dynamin, putative [Bodo saltans]
MTTNAGMEELIQVINDLHDAFSDIKMDIKLNLPQIAVVGSQSSGKSSVLENIVGKDFLPRGSGIVTRCPLVLQLVQLPPTKDEEWGEFLHKPGVKFTDFADIRREIERRTVEVAGAASITDKPISLKVFSPHVLTLTLVDLPGMVMNAVGDQPKDIDKQIKDMVTKYVTPANTIILAVTPANADLATSQALRLAKQVDPDGVRTLGVLTKLDLMDKGTNALDMLSGRRSPSTVTPANTIILAVTPANADLATSQALRLAKQVDPDGVRTLGVLTKLDLMDKGTNALDMLSGRQINLRRGFIGVVNRSQQDINEEKDIRAARAAEKEYFKNNSAYSEVAERQGTEYLCKTLNQLLMEHIQSALRLEFRVRTLGVLTKLDLMDKGTNALDMLSGRQINLRRGFIGVVNRSQQDINDEKDIRAARLAEKEYFKSNSAYSEVADRQGTEYLCKTLNQLLMEHIQSALPDLKAHVDKLVASTHKQMEKLGMFDEQAIEHGALLLQLIKTFSDGLNHAIDGGVTDANKELMGGARLDYIFHESFANYVTTLRASKDLTDEYIRINMRNMAGMNATLFPSDQVFMALARQQIAKLEDPSIKCVNFVHDELHKIVEMCAAKLDRYPSLKKRVLLICSQLIQSYRTPSQAHVRTLIAAEKGYINVKHPVMQQLSSQSIANMNAQQYAANNPQPQGPPPAPGQPAPQGGARASSIPAPSPMSRPMYDVPSKIQLGSSMSPHESAQNAAIREMVEGYFSIVQQNISDQVPKAINLLMIMKLRENIYAQLVRHLYKDDLLADLLSESPDIAAQRKGTSTMMKCLNKAQDALSKVADYIPEK